MIIENVTGKTFQEYVNENIAGISGMTNTSCTTTGDVNVINDKAKLENKANAYVLLNLSIFNGQEWDDYELKRRWNLEEDPFKDYGNEVVLSDDDLPF